jgi:hypothetical protein
MARKIDDSGTESDAQEVRTEADESHRPATPFPRYERIEEALADEPRDPRDSREIEIPRTESYGELWTRAARRARGR